jgi:peptide/nickel transport system substrate-binding protein
LKEKLITLWKSPRFRKGSLIFGVIIFLLLSSTSSQQTVNSTPAFNAGLERAVGESRQAGGILRIASARDCNSLDPAQTRDPWCGVILRLYTRNLLAHAGKPGLAGLEPVPDLAASSPVVTEEFKVWTFTLRENLLWDDGTPVTSADVKYSIERLYDDFLQSPVSNEILCLLSTCSTGKPDYLGPYVPDSGELATITTPDEKTVVFRLTRSFAQFDKVLTTPNFGIISAKRDAELRANGVSYGQRPAASGPFKFVIAEGIYKFIRNEYWKQETDSIRFPQVDEIQWTLLSDSETTDIAVLNGEADLRVDWGLGPSGRDQVLANEETRKLVDNPDLGYTNYLALIPTAAPLDRKPCREAIAYALDKTSLAATHGGTDVSAVANSMSPTNLPGYDKSFNRYPTGNNSTGDIDKAREKLIECGYPDGFTVKFAFAQLGTGPQVYSVLQQSLGRVGIVVDALPFDDFANYVTTGIGSPETVKSLGIGMVASGWAADYNSPISFWSPLVDGRKIVIRSNQNLPLLENSKINQLLDYIEFGKTDDLSSANKQIEQLVAEEAVYFPLSSDSVLLYRPAYLTNVYVQLALGASYDLVNIGANPKPQPSISQ